MKLLLVLLMTTTSIWAGAEAVRVEPVNSVSVELDGETIEMQVDKETAIEVAAKIMSFYECRAVSGGWRRCSKSTGKCFGAVFAIKKQCEDVLNDEHK